MWKGIMIVLGTKLLGYCCLLIAATKACTVSMLVQTPTRGPSYIQVDSSAALLPTSDPGRISTVFSGTLSM